MGAALKPIYQDDWVGIRYNFNRIKSVLFGPDSTPTFAGVVLKGLTTNALIYAASGGTIASLGVASDGQIPIGSTGTTPVLAGITGTADEIDVTNAAGSITIGLVNPLIVGKGGTGVATLTNHGILLGSGTLAVTPLGVAANGKIPIGSVGADPVLAEITGTANQVVSTPGAGSITLSTPQNIHTAASNFTVAGATIDGIVLGGVYDVQEEPTGFVDRTATLSWNDGTRTLTITGDHDIYINGVKTTKSTDSILITDATDLYWVYYNAAGTLVASTTHPGWALPIMATVYWNTDGGGGSYNKGLAGDERHGLVMDWSTHEYLHNTVGSRYESGLAGTFDNTTLSIATGEWHDEDIEHALVSPETTCNVLYKNGSAAWEWDAGASVYYKLNGTALRYNNGNNLADCTPNRYMAMWIFATNDISVPIVALMGQRQDTTLKNARANNTYDTLSFGELPFWEMKILYRVILRSTGSPPTYTETLDLRAVSNLPAGTYIATDHAVLTGLTNDDHTQYLLADGTRALAGAWNMGSQILTNVNIDTGDINVAVVNTEWDTAYTHSQLSSGNPHSVTPTELSLVIGTNTQAWDAGLDNLAALAYVSDSFIKVTATDTYAIRTITETKTDLSLNNVSNVATSDVAYNAGTWDANTNAATKNAIRDKFVTNDAAIASNTTHRSSDGSDHSIVGSNTTAIGLNTTHRGSVGTDHSDVGLNNTHRSSDGSNHSFIDQSVLIAASPTFAGLTVTNAAVLGSDSIVFQPNTDSTTFLQVLDADGGNPVLNIDTTNERVGIGTTGPLQPLHVFENSGSYTVRLESDHVNGVAGLVLVDDAGSVRGVVGHANSNFNIIGVRDSTFIGTLGVLPFHVVVNSSVKITALNNGNVGINTTSPDTKLQVAGDCKFGDDTTNYIGITTTGDISFTGSAGFYPRRVSQADIPAAGTGATQIDTGELMVWRDSDDGVVYLVYRDTTSGIKSVALG